MNRFRQWKLETTARSIVQTLSECGYDAHYAVSLEDAKALLLSMIPEGASVGLGGSATLDEMDILPELRSGRYRLFDRYAQKSFADDIEQRRLAMTADFFLCGANAITRAGELVNVDASGSRVAAMMFGPRRVIVAAGANKVVGTLDDAFARLREIAPMNCMRNGHSTPCTADAACHDCADPQRMCNCYGVIRRGDKFPGRISVIIVAGEHGF
jgi:hypothetical protein